MYKMYVPPGTKRNEIICKICKKLGTVKMDSMGLYICDNCWFNTYCKPKLKNRNSGVCELCRKDLSVTYIDIAHDEDRSACFRCYLIRSNNKRQIKCKTLIEMLNNIKCYKSDRIKKQKLLMYIKKSI